MKNRLFNKSLYLYLIIIIALICSSCSAKSKSNEHDKLNTITPYRPTVDEPSMEICIDIETPTVTEQELSSENISDSSIQTETTTVVITTVETTTVAVSETTTKATVEQTTKAPAATKTTAKPTAPATTEATTKPTVAPTQATTLNDTSNAAIKTEAEANAISYKNYYERVLALTNEIRASVGVSPLTLDDTLCKAASIRAVEMDRNNNMSHVRPDGTSCFTVYDVYGIRFFNTGENIAAGYPSPEAVVEGWKNSEGHYENMINPNFNKLGVGYSKTGVGSYGHYWAQMFTN